MSKKKNSVWGFFASTKLALFCFFSLATASIIGTLIPQKEQAAVYIQKYGPKTAELFQILNIPDMYNSWWFMGLLSLFSINLIICSLDRFPAVWKLITLDNLKTKVDRLKKMLLRNSFTSDKPISEVVPLVEQTMSEAGWKPSQAEREGGTLLFAQKTPWVRSGVYIVHVSILVIFAGAIIGSLFGSKGSIMAPEKNTINYIYERGTGKQLPIGFNIRVDGFSLSYYDNGSPKEYRSDLTVFENGQEVLKKSIVVNDPLQYNGFTFYQS
ncbi:MAG: cytochrome c biogenesis protein ResB, partial [Proteobacteria bacterium]|nr:cytochrome c biogenesis protein ResB [Pseudomonadota bacterium]